MLIYANQVYNKDVIQGEPGAETIYSNIGMAELSYKISDERSIRMEMQHLFTKQHRCLPPPRREVPHPASDLAT